MNGMRKIAIGAGMAASALVGGAVGTALIAPSAVSAQTTSTTAQPSTPNGLRGTAFKPNEDPTHEASESPQREAAENSGQMPGPGTSQQSPTGQ